MPYELEAHDYQLKYDQTYIGVKEGETILPFYVQELGHNKGGLCFVGKLLKNKEWSDKQINVKDPSLYLEFPEIGFKNLRSGLVFYIGRLAVKQYKETLHEGVIRIFDPFEEERKLLGIRRIVRLDNKFLLDVAFNNKFYSPETAVNLVTSFKRGAAAWDSEWCIGIKHNPNKFCIMKGQHIVGTFVSGKVHLPSKVDFLREELELYGFQVKIV